MKKLTKVLAGVTLAAALIGGSVVPASAAGGLAVRTALTAGCASLPQTTTEFDGVAGPIFYKRLQCLGSIPGAYGYRGPIDGVMGPNSWTGVSEQLAKGGYYQSGDLATSGNAQVIKALQRWAKAHGQYGGDIDGKWSLSTYRGAAWALNRAF